MSRTLLNCSHCSVTTSWLIMTYHDPHHPWLLDRCGKLWWSRDLVSEAPCMATLRQGTESFQCAKLWTKQNDMKRLETHKLKKTARPLVALASGSVAGFVAQVAACRHVKLNTATRSRLARSPPCRYVASRPSLGRSLLELGEHSAMHTEHSDPSDPSDLNTVWICMVTPWQLPFIIATYRHRAFSHKESLLLVLPSALCCFFWGLRKSSFSAPPFPKASSTFKHNI